jgi:hypothetical protein
VHESPALPHSLLAVPFWQFAPSQQPWLQGVPGFEHVPPHVLLDSQAMWTGQSLAVLHCTQLPVAEQAAVGAVQIAQLFP